GEIERCTFSRTLSVSMMYGRLPCDYIPPARLVCSRWRDLLPPLNSRKLKELWADEFHPDRYCFLLANKDISLSSSLARPCAEAAKGGNAQMKLPMEDISRVLDSPWQYNFCCSSRRTSLSKAKKED